MPERYEDFLGELPKFAPDPRQDQFRASVGPVGAYKKVKIDQRLGKVEIANVGRGWPATAPNLGFLQNGMQNLIELGKLDPFSKKEVAAFVGWAVQRVTRVTLSKEAAGEMVINFWTKDDYGGYAFGFPISFDPEL